jgi:hypothetical protein
LHCYLSDERKDIQSAVVELVLALRKVALSPLEHQAAGAYESVRFAVGRVALAKISTLLTGWYGFPFVQWPTPAEPTLDHT